MKADIILIIGALAICAGVALIYYPAAIILAGVFLVFFSFSIHKAGK